jgi:hypothetical protein
MNLDWIKEMPTRYYVLFALLVYIAMKVSK